MAFAGLKKQINKANQYVSEKIGGAEGTKFTEDFCEMERRTDLTNELVEDLILKTKEYLQPNPATRAKLMMSNKLRTGPKVHAYQQPEGILGDSMVKFGKDLGEDSVFANSLMEAGESMRQMAEVKYALEDNVKQNFLEPLHHLQTKDLKDVMHHRKKLQGRRLDYDCKKRKQAKDTTVKPRGTHVTEDEIKLAEDKFEESFNLASMGMHNLLENEVEQISQLAAFVEGLTEYHQQCAEILQQLQERLNEHKQEAMEKPREPYQPKSLNELNIPSMMHDDISPGIESGAKFNGSLTTMHPARSPASSPVNPRPIEPLFLSSNFNNPNQGGGVSPARSPNARTPMRQQPCCQALYDFDPENEGELGFKESDVINLINRIDDNWYEGTLNGKTGLFPVSYVQVLVPLP